MPVITLPDGSQRQFDQAVSIADIAADIGPGLAKAALAGRVDGQLVDTAHVIAGDAEVAIITSKNDEGLEIIRHSTSHLLAQAVQKLFPQAQVTIGPVIENGFYYDFAFERAFTPEDLVAIEAKMLELAGADLPLQREVMQRDDAVEYFKGIGEHYKAEIIADIPSDDPISLYRQGDWVDLCRGPHVPSTGFLKAFKLTSVAGAYWRGDSNNEMLQRIYGTAWPDKKALKQYLVQLEEAERRDHRRIGKDLDLFSLQEEAGGGLVFWHPKGARIRRVMEDFWREQHTAAGYELLYTPHIALQTLWDTSGHTDFYREGMYQPMEDDNRQYQLKPMNCPFHVLIYKNTLRSHRDLPMRWAELGTVYRHEMSGALHGLMRVRGFTQDDAHVFCREEQIADEIVAILNLTLETLAAFGFDDFSIDLSTRPEKAVGSDEIWTKATAALRAALETCEIDYSVDEGGGAFYGPKIDVKIRDAIGRQWQCSTIQLDFNLPERFDMEYVAEDGTRQRPIMIHRALLGSLERFFGILIEHFEGRFPAWLAPVQAVILNITDRQNKYALSIAETLNNQGLRVETDLRNEKIGFKIRQHTLQRVPYLLVVGDREAESNTVAVRTREGKDLGSLSIDEFARHLNTDVAGRGQTILED
ncbi:MAG: threonine--tRNA ligase [Gammaproteobacteria bacterium]|jgi:threonyl-tRNA synthetase|nr:threonine--tRNA ligase [Gammaproteobacteria bacterium]